NAAGADRAYDLDDVVDLGQVLTNKADEGDLVAQFKKVECTARDLGSFPPANVRVKRAPQVVLEDLSLVERPAMVFVLADVNPPFAHGHRQRPTFFESRVHADMHPVAGQPPRLW